MTFFQKHLPEEKPRMMCAVWRPDTVLQAVRAGIDIFDTSYPFHRLVLVTSWMQSCKSHSRNLKSVQIWANCLSPHVVPEFYVMLFLTESVQSFFFSHLSQNVCFIHSSKRQVGSKLKSKMQDFALKCPVILNLANFSQWSKMCSVFTSPQDNFSKLLAPAYFISCQHVEKRNINKVIKFYPCS